MSLKQKSISLMSSMLELNNNVDGGILNGNIYYINGANRKVFRYYVIQVISDENKLGDYVGFLSTAFNDNPNRLYDTLFSDSGVKFHTVISKNNVTVGGHVFEVSYRCIKVTDKKLTRISEMAHIPIVKRTRLYKSKFVKDVERLGFILSFLGYTSTLDPTSADAYLYVNSTKLAEGLCASPDKTHFLYYEKDSIGGSI